MGLLKKLSLRFNRNSRRSAKGKHDNASIVDFADKSALMAVMAGRRRVSGSIVGSASVVSSEESSISSFGDPVDLTPVEWTLPLVDKTCTEPQTMEEEMKRLEVLNSYFVLDSDGEEAFDRITSLGAKMFDVPICVISLVDLGRQWFLSKVGLDAAETARKHAFCAHVILNKYRMLVIPDASKDFRFKDNPLVTDGLKIRFYAGAALVSKEGYKLGTCCVISPVARPQGLNETEMASLHDLAAMTVSAMEARRNRLLKEEYESKFHSLARSFLDTTHHLEEAKANVEKVMVCTSWGVGEEESKMLSRTADILDLQSKLCAAAMRTTLQDTPVPTKNAKSKGFQEDGHISKDLDNPITDMKTLFDNINAIISNFPRQDVVTVEIDSTVPKKIGSDDLLLFRAVLNMLTQCMGSSTAGEACGIRIRRMKRDDNELLVQCLLGGKPITKMEAKALFDNRDSLLAPVASIVRSMGGSYGMYEAKWDLNVPKADTHSIFWFQVPYETTTGRCEKFSRNLFKIHGKPNAATMEKLENDKAKMDPFQKALLANGCGRLPVR